MILVTDYQAVASKSQACDLLTSLTDAETEN